LKTYRDLDVWQKAVELVLATHELAASYPDGGAALADLSRRAAIAVPARIAEGHARLNRKDYLRYLSMAKGAVAELETHLVLAARLHYVKPGNTKKAWALAQDVEGLLRQLMEAIERGI